MMILLLIIIALLLTKQTYLRKRVDKGSLTEPCHVSYADTVSLVTNEQVHTMLSPLDDETSTDVPSKVPTISSFSQELFFTSSLRSSRVDTGTNTDCSYGGKHDLFIQFERAPSYSELCLDVVRPNKENQPYTGSTINSENQPKTELKQSEHNEVGLQLTLSQNAGSKCEDLDFSDCRAEEVIDIDIPCDSPRSDNISQSTGSPMARLSQSLNTNSTDHQDNSDNPLVLASVKLNNEHPLSLRELPFSLTDNLKKENREADLQVTEICLIDDVLSAEEENIPLNNTNETLGERPVCERSCTEDSGKELAADHTEQSPYSTYTETLCLESGNDDNTNTSPQSNSWYSHVLGLPKKQRRKLDDLCFYNQAQNEGDSTNVYQSFGTMNGPITFL